MMRKGLLGSLTALLAGAGMASAQAPAAAPAAAAPMPSQPVVVQPAPAGASTVIVEGTPGAYGDHGMTGDADGGGPKYRLWGSAEYLYWWLKGANNPPLVTTGPVIPLGTPGAPGAILGTPGTSVLVGGSSFNDDGHSGGRFTLGGWLDDCHGCGLEVSYFFLGRNHETATAGGTGAPGTAVIGRPFFDVSIGAPAVETVALPLPIPLALALAIGAPGVEAGSVTVNENTRLEGWEVNAVKCCANECDYSLQLLAGFRELELEDSLTITENITVLPGAAFLVPALPPLFFTPGTRLTIVDRFDTRNYFYGGQVGARAEVRRGRMFVNGTAKVALGETHEIVGITGSTTVVTPAGGTLGFPGGLLALPTNIGRYTRDQFAVVPEVNLNVGYAVTDALRVFVGYTYLYWSDVARPGDQINLNVNSTFAPSRGVAPAGLPLPNFQFHSTDFWAQGLNVGLEFRY